MRCMVCDSDMVLMKVLSRDPEPVPDFEWRFFRCLGCRSVERHLVFLTFGREADAEPLPVRVAFGKRRGPPLKKALEVFPRLDAAPSVLPDLADQEEDRTINLALFKRLVAKVHRRKNSGEAHNYVVVKERDEKPPERMCKMCRSPMLPIGTLPASPKYSMHRIYKCSGCRFVTADTVDA